MYKLVNRLLSDIMNELYTVVPNDTAYTRWSCYSGLTNPVQIVSTPPVPSNGGQITIFWASQSCASAWWLVLLLIKAGDVETNPGPTNTRKQVWILRYQPQTYTSYETDINTMEQDWTLTAPKMRRCALDKTPVPRTPAIYALIAPTPPPDSPVALPLPSHPHILAAHTHATQTTVHTAQSPQQPHSQHRVPRQPHRQSKDYNRTTNTTQAHRPSSKSERNLIIAGQHKRNQKQTRGAQTAFSRHTRIYHHNSGNQAHP